MDKENFKTLFVEAGFKNKQELAKALNLSYSCVTQWGCGDVKFPPYLKVVLEWAIKAKKYDEALLKKGFESLNPEDNAGDEKSELERLRLENAKMREELENYESLKRALKRALEE